MGGRATRRFKY